MSSAPLPRLTPRIQTRASWGAPWSDDVHLRVDGVLERVVGSAGTEQATFTHLYGPLVKHVGQDALEESPPLNYVANRTWVRISDPESGNLVWQGRFFVDRRRAERSSSGVRGRQTLIAFGGLELLRRITVRSSWWWNATTHAYEEMGWVPSINRLGPAGQLIGTRGISVPGYPYAYGNDDFWTHEDYLEYLLRFHVEQTGGPTWDLEDLTNTLDNRSHLIDLGDEQSVLEIVRKIVLPSDGVEFVVVPVDAGYTLRVFALAGTAQTFGTVTLPANGNVKTFRPTTDLYTIGCEIEDSYAEVYDGVEALGDRIESCFTIAPADKRNLWTSAQETAYKDASTKGSPTTADHDLARSDDLHRMVYAGFGAPVPWDWNDGDAAPVLDDEGTVDGTGAPNQDKIRATLRRTPMREGGDYTSDSPDVSGATEDTIPPLAVVKISAARGYALADKLGQADLETDDALVVDPAVICALQDDWGLIVQFPANYMHARNHWAAGSPADSMIEPDTECIDYSDTYLTLAALTDQRLRCRQLAASLIGDGSRKVVMVRGAKVQYIAPDTVVGVDTDGTVRQAPEEGVVVRNDNTRLHALMAGAIARYLAPRIAISITWQGQWPLPDWLGWIAQLGTGEGDMGGRQGIITSIWWDFEKGTSGIRAGYA
jgi:hypothetical protein